MEDQSLKQFAKDRILLELHIEELEKYSIKVKKHEDFEASLEKRGLEDRWISGYLWALYDAGVISSEQRELFARDADLIWNASGTVVQEEGGQADVGI